ncbi:cytochrome P450 [Actinacidiphila guanduensis]|uniref:Pentalenene oxygenase n=1 Tax=Actinacidiphila guanduensis TaxID=310781 RepID=A0A1H0L9Z2_9ACTN|nr:cytochrome P450 [Actinacidiphila guanduensis]SDO64801.1 pentalenene oxygenase [Actinacidiphila guanduensis]
MADTAVGPREGLVFGRAPAALPLLGHAPALWRRPLRFMESLSEHGDLVEIRLAWHRVFVVCHPELARRVLTDLAAFDRTGLVYDTVRASLGSGLATAPHADHRRQRLVMQPAFHHSRLPEYAAVMREEVAATMRRWQPGETVDLVQEMFRLTNTISLRAFFSTGLGAEEARELHESLDVFLRVIYRKAMLSMVGGVPSFADRRFARAVEDWRGKVSRLIEARRRAGGDGNDLMARLMAARDDEQRPMSDAELSDQVALLLLAGGETTSAAIFWTLQLLITHPEVLAEVRRETDEVLGAQVAGWEHAHRLGAVTRALREAMRLYPPSWILPRTCVRDTELAGHTVPAGSLVLFSPLVLHRRADLFPSPRSFTPDRWLSTAAAGAAAPRGAYLPFGGGATKCIGEDFGMTEAVLILATLITRWDLSPAAAPEAPLTVRTVLAPAAYPVRLTRRELPTP